MKFSDGCADKSSSEALLLKLNVPCSFYLQHLQEVTKLEQNAMCCILPVVAQDLELERTAFASISISKLARRAFMSEWCQSPDHFKFTAQTVLLSSEKGS